jgi:hypothetical protein
VLTLREREARRLEKDRAKLEREATRRRRRVAERLAAHPDRVAHVGEGRPIM